MKYFKNTELAKLYYVSEKTVRNWIDAALAGKLDLQLHQENGKQYVANTAKNNTAIEELVVKGKKYKNTRGFKVVQPSSKFYTMFSPKQIADIISNLDIHREIPLQYSYFNSGAKRWDKYTQNLSRQKAPNSLTNTIYLLENSLDYIDAVLNEYKNVNVIDIGVGNALPIRPVLSHFLQKGKLKRYIGIDISKTLLDIAEHNINSWFGDKVHFEGHIRDINYDRFSDLIFEESFGVSDEATANVVFFLGGTISNFRDPSHVLSVIRDSMGKNDLFITTRKLDTESSRRYFEIAVQGNQEIDLVLKHLNIDESLYTIKQYFDPSEMARKIEVELNVALSVKFKLADQEKTIEFNKGERILIWRSNHQSAVGAIQMLNDNNFDLIQATRSLNHEYVQLISRLKTAAPN